MAPDRLPTPPMNPGDQTQPPCTRRDDDKAWFLQRGLTAQHLDRLVAQYNGDRYFSEDMVLDVLKNTLHRYGVSAASPLASLADIEQRFAACLQDTRHELRQDAWKTTLRIYRDMWQLVPPQLAPDVNNFLRCDNNFLVERDRFVSNVMPWVVKQLQGKRQRPRAAERPKLPRRSARIAKQQRQKQTGNR